MANYGVNINFKVIGQSKLDRALKKTEQLDKKVDLLNKRGIKGIASSVKILNQELAIKNKILKADKQILNVRNKQVQANKRNIATQPVQNPTGGRSARRGGAGGALSSAIVSGAFPLLFGQGPLVGAAGFLGGGIGSLVGGPMGGFAGGLLATSIATPLQQFGIEVGKLGQALNENTKNVDAITTALGISGTEFEKNIKVLQKLGLEEEAFEAARRKMIGLVGDKGVKAMTEFGEQFQDLGNSFAEIMTLLKSSFAQFMQDSGIMKFFTTRVERFNLKRQAETTGQFSDFAEGKELQRLLKQRDEISKFGGLHPDDRAKLILSITGREEGMGFGGAVNERDEMLARKILNDLIVAQQEIVNQKKEERDLDMSAKDIVVGKVNLLEDEFRFKESLLPLSKEEREIEMEIEKIREAVKEIKGEEAVFDEKAIRDQLEKNRGLDKELALTEQLEDAFKRISESINNDIKNGIKGLIKGTSTLGDLLSNVADKFLDLALNQALFGSALGVKGEKGGGLLGAIGLFANGGNPPVNKPSIVGERGPELFVPRSAGTIIPNENVNVGGGSTSIVVNVDASGTSVEGNEANGEELGRLIGAVVQSELIKEKRPGGLLA